MILTINIILLHKGKFEECLNIILLISCSFTKPTQVGSKHFLSCVLLFIREVLYDSEGYYSFPINVFLNESNFSLCPLSFRTERSLFSQKFKIKPSFEEMLECTQIQFFCFKQLKI